MRLGLGKMAVRSGFVSCGAVFPHVNLVAECIHFTFFGIMLPTIKLKVYTFGGL